MKYLVKTAAVSALAFSSIYLSGCATIVTGADQMVQVDTTPVNAVVTINQQSYGKTPARINLDRSTKNAAVEINLEGYESKVVHLKRGVNGWVWGNIAFGGLIGLVIDSSSGAMYAHKIVNTGEVVEVPASSKQKPENTDLWINVVLKPQPKLTVVGQLKPVS